jgi:hypothetical protein
MKYFSKKLIFDKLKNKASKFDRAHSFDSMRGLKKYYSLGIEIFSGFVTAILIAWGIGYLLGIPLLWRIIGGVVLATMVNWITLYKAIKK